MAYHTPPLKKVKKQGNAITQPRSDGMGPRLGNGMGPRLGNGIS